MDNPNSYVLLNDRCDCCLYVSNAFTFLRLPLQTLGVEELSTSQAIIQNATAIIMCENIETKYTAILLKALDNTEANCVSFMKVSEYAKLSRKPVRHLSATFSKYELQQLLSKCHIIATEFDNYADLSNTYFEKLLGNSPKIREIRAMIKQVADTDTTVLIQGESGTGKDVIASCIHYLSSRKDKPLVPINCGAIPGELMESELFGHEKGAFTGAVNRRAGRFEMADGGTLFLDEIGDMPLAMQVKLLRVIQERKVERVGGTTSQKVDVRLIAATNKHLEQLIQEHQFREDLFYRLNVFPIQAPSLSERADDIPLLIEYHIEKLFNRLKHRIAFTDRATEILCQYSWPGNIRELENFLERMVILHPDGILDEGDIDVTYRQKKVETANTLPPLNSQNPFNIKEYIASIEQQMIRSALEQSNGVISAAAEYLSLGRTTLIEKMKKYNLASAK